MFIFPCNISRASISRIYLGARCFLNIQRRARYISSSKHSRKGYLLDVCTHRGTTFADSKRGRGDRIDRGRENYEVTLARNNVFEIYFCFFKAGRKTTSEQARKCGWRKKKRKRCPRSECPMCSSGNEINKREERWYARRMQRLRVRRKEAVARRSSPLSAPHTARGETNARVRTRYVCRIPPTTIQSFGRFYTVRLCAQVFAPRTNNNAATTGCSHIRAPHRISNFIRHSRARARGSVPAHIIIIHRRVGIVFGQTMILMYNAWLCAKWLQRRVEKKKKNPKQLYFFSRGRNTSASGARDERTCSNKDDIWNRLMDNNMTTAAAYMYVLFNSSFPLFFRSKKIDEFFKYFSRLDKMEAPQICVYRICVTRSLFSLGARVLKNLKSLLYSLRIFQYVEIQNFAIFFFFLLGKTFKCFTTAGFTKFNIFLSVYMECNKKRTSILERTRDDELPFRECRLCAQNPLVYYTERKKKKKEKKSLN